MSARAIVALDVGSAAQAAALTARLGAACDFVKVGLELFTAEGPAIVRAMIAERREVFLDLKLHDIPNTVRGAARSAAASGATLVQVGTAAMRDPRVPERIVRGLAAWCAREGVTRLADLIGCAEWPA